MKDKTLELIKKTAESETLQEQDGFDPSDGGNFDDTFQSGVEDGSIFFAREILISEGIKFKIKEKSV